MIEVARIRIRRSNKIPKSNGSARVWTPACAPTTTTTTNNNNNNNRTFCRVAFGFAVWRQTFSKIMGRKNKKNKQNKQTQASAAPARIPKPIPQDAVQESPAPAPKPQALSAPEPKPKPKPTQSTESPSAEAGDEVTQASPSKQKFTCAKCKKVMTTPPEEEIRGLIVQVQCEHCQTANFLQYHCWACRTPLDGIDYNAKGVQGQCPECGAFNPAKKPRVKDSWDDCSNRCVDRIMFGFTAFIQPYCVYAQTMWIYPYILNSMDAHGSTLEKVLYGITLFVSAGTLFNYWSGVFTPIKLHRTPDRSEIRLKSRPETQELLNLTRYHYCQQCKAPRAPRDHHCNICRTCVPVMDHHCPFYGGSCVGRHNHRNFILFLLYMMLTTVWLATSTVANWKHLPSFPSWVFQREFSKKIMAHCARASPFCPMQYVSCQACHVATPLTLASRRFLCLTCFNRHLRSGISGRLRRYPCSALWSFS